MDVQTDTQGIITETAQDDRLEAWCEAFLINCQARSKSSGTIKFHRDKLGKFCQYCETQAVSRIKQVTPGELRAFLIYLQDTQHSPGGIHAFYRSLKAFLRWYEDEAEPIGWKNPIIKVKLPRPRQEPLEPVDLTDVKAMLKTCGDNFHGLRDRAALLMLLDTGARASELLALDISDIDMISGAVLIRQGKGGKSRTVFMGKAARKALRKYNAARPNHSTAIFVTEDGDRLTYNGLRYILKRRAEAAGIIPSPTLHDFRRAFAINMLRAGVDVFSLQKLMGHADLQVLRRYLAQTTEDIAQAHRMGSPVDNNKL